MARAPIPQFPINPDPRIQVTRTQRFNVERLSPNGFSGGRFSASGMNVSDPGSTVNRRSGRAGSAPSISARLPRAPMGGVNIRATPLLAGLNMLSKGLDNFAAYRNDKAEIARRAYVLEQAPIIRARFDALEDGYKERKGSTAAGIPEEVGMRRQELIEANIPEDVDERTKNDLRAIANQEYEKLIKWSHSYEVSQFDIADKIQQQAIRDNLTRDAIKIAPGSDIEEVHAVVQRAMNKFSYLHTDIPEESKGAIRKAFVDDATAAMLQAWMADAPGIAVKYFDKHESMLKAKMPTHYSQIAKQINASRGEALKDEALAFSYETWEGNLASMAQDFTDSDFVDKHMGGDYTGAFSIANTLMAQAESQTRATERATARRHDAIFEKIAKENMDEDGTINYASAIQELNRQHHMGLIDTDVYEKAMSNWTQREFTQADRMALYDKIDKGGVSDYHEILAEMRGNEDPMKYISYFDKVKDARKKHKEVDQLAESMKYWDGVADTARGKKGTYGLSPEDRPLFERILREWAISEGYTYLDREVLDQAVEMLKPAKLSGETVTPAEDYPSDLWFGPEYGRQWKLVPKAQDIQDQRARGESQVTPSGDEINVIDTSAPAQIATGGNLADPQAAAIDRLKAEGYPITPEYISKMQQIMEVELNEEAENEGQETTEEGPAERAEGEAAEDTGVTTPTEGETGGNADLSGAFETLEKQGAGLSDIQKQILENEIKAAPKTTLTTPDTGEFTPEAESGAVESEDTGESGESQIKKYAPTNVEDAEVIDKAIDTNAKANGLDPDFVAAVIQAESSFKKDAVSYAGAEGLMQMLPGTAKDMGVSDSKDPEDNIKGGTKYLAKIMEMMKKAGKEPLIDWVLAGYNAGPYGAVKWTTIPNDIRTQYIDKIKMEMRRLKESS